MSTSFRTPPSRVVYPDDNGEPMAENTLQFEWIVTIKGGLEALFRDRPDVFVAGDLLWYPVEGEPAISTAPDTMVAFGRPKGYRGSYKQWEEGDIAPQVVFEVLSPGNRPHAMGRKLRFYEQYGVQEYYLYDPESGDLEGWLRSDGKLVEIPRMAGFVSPLLQIRFEPGEGPDNLTILDPRGVPFATYVELVEQREAEKVRADEAGRRAEEERRRAEEEHRRAEEERHRAEEAVRLADAERSRANRLADRLRQLGIEPD
jgi:Uma2 family endonuclease